jgi:ferrochelatase
VLWWLVLNGIILTVRPKKSGHAYDKIWNRERNESPLKTITRSQAEKVAARFNKRQKIIVDWGMRYGQPAIGERIAALKEQGCDRILLAPLYPQYSATTTATALDKAYEALQAMRWQPAIRTLPPYHDHPAYIDALARSLKSHVAQLGWQPEMILASFHGLPESYLLAGDPFTAIARKRAAAGRRLKCHARNCRSCSVAHGASGILARSRRLKSPAKGVKLA